MAAVDKKLLANAGDMSSIPALGRSPHAVEQLKLMTTTLQSLSSRDHVLQLLKPTYQEPVLHSRRHRNERPMDCNNE